MKQTLPQRILAIDGFRAVTLLLMLFVNDIPGLHGVPHWLHHAGWNEDMLGFSDTIFPAFLFAVGLSIPLAIQNRMEKGDSLWRVLLHIGERTFALLLMGLFMVNLDSLDSSTCVLSHHWYVICMVIGFFLVWNSYPHAETKSMKYLFIGLRMAGTALLVFLYLIYKGNNGQLFGIQWWGILGLIGWTYMVCALVYLFTKQYLMRTMVVWVLFVVLSVLTHSGVLNLGVVPSDMTLHALGMSGVLTAILMQRLAHKKSSGRFLLFLSGLGLIMLAAFFVSHPYWIISKIQATPTWLFICTAIYFPLFGLFYWLMDVKGKTGWFAAIKPAGTVTLTCYMLPYVWYSVQGLLGWWYPHWMNTGIPGLIRSLVYSLIIVQLAWLLMKLKVRLKV